LTRANYALAVEGRSAEHRRGLVARALGLNDGSRGGVVVLPAAGKPVDRAVSYRVRLIEVDQTELWTASATSPSIEIPAEVRARITPLKKLLWEVTAIDTDGRSVATSGTQSFRLSR
jgi:hypothetical protein